MSKSIPTAPATASVVRAWAKANPSLVPAEGEHTVRDGARGRLHPSVREAFNANVSRSARYTEGTPKQVPLTYRHAQPSGRTVAKTVLVPEVGVRLLAGDLAGKRGPLSKAALAGAAEALAESVKG